MLLAATLLLGVVPIPAAHVETDPQELIEQSGAPGGLEEARKTLEEGDADKAAALARDLLEQTENEIGRDSIETAPILDLLAEVLLSLGPENLREARVLAERAVAIKEQAHGSDYPGLAPSLILLGKTLQQQNQHEDAARRFRKAVAIRTQHPGPSRLDLAEAQVYLANLLLEFGDYGGAKSLYESILEIREQAPGPACPWLTGSLYNLANVLRDMSDWDAARPLFERALALEVEAHGEEHLHVTYILNGMAILLEVTGNYEDARTTYERALKIAETIDPRHPIVASCLNNLGHNLKTVGDNQLAKETYERSLDLAINIHGEEHRYVASTMRNLAEVHYLMGDLDGARELYEKALVIRRKVQGERHPDVGTSLVTLADLMRELGEDDTARRYYEEALEIWEEALPEDHPDFAIVFRGLARLFDQTGDDEPARKYYRESVRVREKSFGPDHPRTAAAYRDLGSFLARRGEAAEALELVLRAEMISRDHLRLTARTMSERQALSYASVRVSGLDSALSLAANGIDSVSIRRIWDSVIRSRALVLDEMASRNRVVGESAEDPEIAALARKYLLATRHLETLTLSGPAGEDPERFPELFRKARAECETAERALAEKSLRFRHERALLGLGWDEVMSHIPPDGALVAFAQFDASVDWEPLPSYLGLILPAGGVVPIAVPIGPAVEIEPLVERWREEAARGALKRQRSREESEAAYRLAGEALRRRLWDPIAEHLGDAGRVFVVPDGVVNLVNLAALPSGEDSYLIESGPLIHYLSAERDLAPHEAGHRRGEGFLVVGGPAFDETSASRSHVPAVSAGRNPAVSNVAARQPFRGPLSECGDFRRLRFLSLDDSAGEAEDLASMWKESHRSEAAGRSTMLIGKAASEGAFKEQAPGKRVLHLATHGFFLGGDCHGRENSSHRGIGGLTSARADSTPLVGVDNPLLLAGLALTGANRRDSVGPGEEDGILTAQEIAALDLSGVEWAVLSACDTAVGEVRANEGVFGLRRAFEIAGAESLIMSLWAIDDKNTREWMNQLYRSRFLKGMPTADAVREASLMLLAKHRESGDGSHPFYWAGFVAAGEWR